MTVPVVFIHFGFNDIIRCAVQQASRLNDVIVVGDASLAPLAQLPRVTLLPLEQFQAGIDRFNAVYVHMHPRNDGFEQFCFSRWFVLRNVMQHLKLDTIFYADSDVMLFTDVSTRCGDYAHADCAYCIPYIPPMPYPWGACGHCSFWTRKGINDLAEFNIACYTDRALLDRLKGKWSSHLQPGAVPGGICDMTTLWLHHESGAFKVQNLLRPIKGHAFDHNMNIPHNLLENEYEMAGPIKHVRFQDGVPHAHRLTCNETIIFDALHFQGSAKVLMPQCLALATARQ